jgi:penicillin-binding protein 2
MDELLQRLGELVQLDASDIRNFKKQLRKRPRFESLVLRTRLNDQEAARIAVNRSQLHGVELQARLQRYYPLGGLAVHAIGYVGRIDEQESSGIDRSAYRGTQHIGKLGVEGRYEGLLLGQVGVEKVETNALGRTLRAVERIAPKAGQNLYLNLDAKLQATAEAALEGRRGAVVALDPKTGGVLVFASTPVYDPNPFVDGIDSESYRILLEDPDTPRDRRSNRSSRWARWSRRDSIPPKPSSAGARSSSPGQRAAFVTGRSTAMGRWICMTRSSSPAMCISTRSQ